MDGPYLIKLAVIGSRGFNNYDYLEDKLAEFHIAEIISGGAKGADSLAIRYAKKQNLPFREFLPDHKQYKHPYHHRNRLIAEYCDKLVAFWDGSSTGTKYTIGYAKKIGKPVYVFKY